MKLFKHAAVAVEVHAIFGVNAKPLGTLDTRKAKGGEDIRLQPDTTAAPFWLVRGWSKDSNVPTNGTKRGCRKKSTQRAADHNRATSVRCSHGRAPVRLAFKFR